MRRKRLCRRLYGDVVARFESVSSWTTNLKFAPQNSPFVQFNAALIECHASLLSSCFCNAPPQVSWGGVLRDETRDECHARPPNGLWLNCFLRDVTRSLLCT